MDLVDYFERTWIGLAPRVGKKRKNPDFPLILWNSYQVTIEGDPRTTNALEGFHNGFHHLVGCDHPTIWKFLKALKKQLVLSHLKLEQANIGIDSSPRRRGTKMIDDSLLPIVKNYKPEHDTLAYLEKIAHLFRFHS